MARRCPLILILFLLPYSARAQSEAALILTSILQGLQAVEAIRQSVERANQYPNPPNPLQGDPIWEYDESVLVPAAVLRNGPYRNVEGKMTLSARQTRPDQIELIFYRPDGGVYRREFVQPRQRNGHRTDLDEKEKRIAEGPIRNGLPVGDWQFFNPQGDLKAETQMVAGKMTGAQTLFTEGGKPRASNTLLEGKRQGPATLFHADGSVSDNLNYSSDKLDGPAQGWWPDGRIRYSANWKNGKLDGPSIEYFPTGQKKSEAIYLLGNKEGLSRAWDEEGHALLEENYRNNLREGPAFSYSPTGIKLSETLFRSGKKNGWAGTWAESGAKLSEGDWQNDLLEGSLREYYPDGKLRTTATYQRGKKNGSYQSFNAEGQLASSAEFKDDKLEGPIKLYYPDGKLFAECHYDKDRLSGGKLLYPQGETLGQFGPVLAGKTNRISSLLLQYPDGKPLSTTQFDALSTQTTWQGWKEDGTSLGKVQLSLDNAESRKAPNLALWSEQQSELEQRIGLSFPPEFNLLPR